MSATDDTTNAGESSQNTLTQRKSTIVTLKDTESPNIPHGHTASRQRTYTLNSLHRISTRRSLYEVLNMNLKPEKKIGDAPTLVQSLRAVVFHSWLNLLLVCIPISWALNFAVSDKHTLIFIFSFIAIIPLAKLLAFATDQLSLRVGQTLAGLLNATLGNAVELIVSIIALVKCELQVVQSSLVGSILSNILLVLGMCFFAGGVRFSEQGFGISPVQLNASLLTVSVIAVLLPAAFHLLVDTTSDDGRERGWILNVSHGTAIILLWIYGCYLAFQLFSHKSLYDDDHPDSEAPKTVKYVKKPKKEKEESTASVVTSTAIAAGGLASVHADASGMIPLRLMTSPLSSEHTDPEAALPVTEPSESDDEEEEKPEMSVYVTFGLLIVVTVIVAVTAEFLVDSINGLTNSGKVSKEFVGLILLPIVGNAAEHATAVTVAVKDKLTLSLGVAVGSSIQIALFVIPFIVTLAWILGKPLTLLFDPLESLALFFSVLVVNYTTQDGKSNWLEGMILMSLYVILAVMFWFYPGVDMATLLGYQCK